MTDAARPDLRHKTMSLALVLALCIAPHRAAVAFDMRECGIDALTFVHPWSKGEFHSLRVGLDVYYLCGPEAAQTDVPSDPSVCRGPYGNLVLEGRLEENGSAEEFTAIYSFLESASPCCGWSVYGVAEAPEISFDTIWLAKGTAPLLREWPIGAISNAWGTRNDLDDMVPLICDLSMS